MRKNKKLVLALAAVLSIVMAMSATFAWFTAKDSVKNHLETKQIEDGSVSILEVFTPPTEWQPGQDVTKTVAVANNGSGAVFVRVSFEEALSVFGGGGIATGYTTTQAAPKVAQNFNTTAYASWQTASAAGLTVTPALPANVVLKVNSITDTTVTPNKTAYSFVPYFDLGGGKFQKMTGDFAVSGTTLTVSNLKYYYFDSYATTKAAWSADNSNTNAAPAKRPLAADIGKVTVDTNGKIALNYETANMNNAAPTAGKWWYNPADGFFYYIGRVESGTISPSLLKSVSLAATAGPEYSGMNFDLFVNMQAIQNTLLAIQASDGWNLSDAALIAALTAFCS